MLQRIRAEPATPPEYLVCWISPAAALSPLYQPIFRFNCCNFRCGSPGRDPHFQQISLPTCYVTFILYSTTVHSLGGAGPDPVRCNKQHKGAAITASSRSSLQLPLLAFSVRHSREEGEPLITVVVLRLTKTDWD